jgi:hypothetical protein
MNLRNTFLAVICAITTLTLCPTITQAALSAPVVGSTTNYSKVNISLTITTNGVNTTKNGVTKVNIGSVKISNASLLALFAQWTTNDLGVWQSAGAQLEFDWLSYQLIVADKTGTNVLFYAGTGVDNGTINAYFTLDWFNAYGPYTETYTDSSPGSDSVVGFSTASFELYYNNSSDATQLQDIFCYGPDVQKYKETWNNTSANWTDAEKFSVNYSGLTYNNETESQVTGAISANGKGPGYNSYFYSN